MARTPIETNDVGENTTRARRYWTDGWMSGWLIANGRMTREDERALMDRPETSFREAALASGRITEMDVMSAIAGRLHLQVVDIDARELDPSLALHLPADLARRFGAVPVGVRDGVVEIAVSDPLQSGIEQALRFGTGRRGVELRLAERAQIEAAQRVVYAAEKRPASSGDLSRLLGRMDEPATARVDSARTTETRAPAQIAELVDAIVAEAIGRRASDIHVEPSLTGVRIRYRIDGVLREVAALGPEYALPLVSRLKVLADLDISDRRRPQDGRAQATIKDRRIDLRISTLPVGDALEKVVLRVLDSEQRAPKLDELGYSENELRTLRALIRQHEGVVLVTGPTGSGKTTTLYGVLNDIQEEGINIVTVEDPIEYRLPGLTQVQVNTRADLTFAAALRSILRQDPDVVLVGEIRDATTADIAFKASMTGHQVFSTLHTNDAPSTVARLLDIGVDAVSIASALKGVVAQRLIRRVCEDCRVPLDPHELTASQRALLPVSDDPQLFRAVGCDACDHTGYRGRVAIAEILPNPGPLARAAEQHVDQAEIEAICRRAGMISMWESGLDRVMRGVTTLHELLDNVAPPVNQTVARPAAGAPVTTPAATVTMPAATVTTLGAPMATTVPPIDGDATEGMDQADIDALLAVMLGGPAATPSTAVVPINDAGRTRSAAATTSGRAPRALVIDEDFHYRQTVRSHLEQAGFRVLEAAHGQSAFTLLGRMRPDLIVTELALSRVDGFELLRAMQDGELPAVPTLVLTAQDEPELRDWALELGAADFLSKSIDGDSIGQRASGVLPRQAVAA